MPFPSIRAEEKDEGLKPKQIVDPTERGNLLFDDKKL